jgi:hypothetical protein
MTTTASSAVSKIPAGRGTRERAAERMPDRDAGDLTGR